MKAVVSSSKSYQTHIVGCDARGWSIEGKQPTLFNPTLAEGFSKV